MCITCLRLLTATLAKIVRSSNANLPQYFAYLVRLLYAVVIVRIFLSYLTQIYLIIAINIIAEAGLTAKF